MSVLIGIVGIVVDSLDEGCHSRPILPDRSIDVDVVSKIVFWVGTESLNYLMLGLEFPTHRFLKT